MRISCDTNVLVYATETLPGSRSIRARDLIARAMRAETAVLLLQCLAPLAGLRLYNVAHCNLFSSGICLPVFKKNRKRLVRAKATR
jgi:hypothetical protein